MNQEKNKGRGLRTIRNIRRKKREKLEGGAERFREERTVEEKVEN